ncbi:MAG: pantetheine-phosphate adenylyltransferase [Promethearchaeati archaeon SRVP18_Atabeyarchaeia-1]
MPLFSCVAVGGTFDRLHEGHKVLLRKAFQVGRKVVIGVATEKLLGGKARRELIYPYERRVGDIKKFLSSEGFLERAELVPISDRFGTTADDARIEALVVSKETASVVPEINQARKKKGLRPLLPVVIEMVLDREGHPIRSTKLREMEGKQK